MKNSYSLLLLILTQLNTGSASFTSKPNLVREPPYPKVTKSISKHSQEQSTDDVRTRELLHLLQTPPEASLKERQFMHGGERPSEMTTSSDMCTGVPDAILLGSSHKGKKRLSSVWPGAQDQEEDSAHQPLPLKKKRLDLNLRLGLPGFEENVQANPASSSPLAIESTDGASLEGDQTDFKISQIKQVT
ncbi:hypothetical protein PGTUg99_010847 [Puccinia graminis f. sp. tritici]|uniref:Uncharacterized protein n=1 Tax=Puccinia graminis f. sp. tritici TaxID=56615 RepID=A0A5B0RPF1_PUCGR|nr:hypothetical protein PGTUg99_010847 [Puccinia graminis f. sp. tritici]